MRYFNTEAEQMAQNLKRFPVDSPSRQVIFAAARVDGKSPEDAKKAVVEGIVQKLKDQLRVAGVGVYQDICIIWNSDKRIKVAIDAVKESTILGRGYRTRPKVIIPAKVFSQHKRGGDLDWASISAHVQIIIQHYARKAKAHQDKQLREERSNAKLAEVKKALGEHVPVFTTSDGDLRIAFNVPDTQGAVDAVRALVAAGFIFGSPK